MSDTPRLACCELCGREVDPAELVAVIPDEKRPARIVYVCAGHDIEQAWTNPPTAPRRRSRRRAQKETLF